MSKLQNAVSHLQISARFSRFSTLLGPVHLLSNESIQLCSINFCLATFFDALHNGETITNFRVGYMAFGRWFRNRLKSRTPKFSVYSTSPQRLRDAGAQSWDCPDSHQNLNNDQAKKQASRLESEGKLVRIIPDDMQDNDGWKST